MIIFGLSKTFRDGETVRWPCHSCGQPAQTGVKFFRYAHVFWLPLLPLGSGQGLVCGHCQHVQVGRTLNDDLRHRLRERNRHVRRPWWHFAGFLLFASLIAWNAVTEDALQQAAAEAAEHPQVGDIWVVDLGAAIPELDSPLKYGTARVSGVDESGVDLAFSDHTFMLSTTAGRQARKAVERRDPGYFEAEVHFSRKALIALQNGSHLRRVAL